MSHFKIIQIRAKLCLLFVLVFAAFIYGEGTAVPAEENLDSILQKIADYCERLKKKVFHFYCEERVVETISKSLHYPEERRGLKRFLEGYQAHQEPSRYEAVRDLRRRREQWLGSDKRIEKKNIYLHDYQIIKEGDQIREQRVLLKLNGKKAEGEIPELQTIIYSYKNVLYPIYLFARGHRDKYDFTVLEKEKVMKRDTHVIEVRHKGRPLDPGAEKNQGLLATAWVDCRDFSIVKFSVFPEAFRGYDYLLRKDRRDRRDIRINDVHYFGEIEGGIRFPSRTEITLSFSEEPPEVFENRRTTPQKIHGARILTQISTQYQYRKYRFFTVNVTDPLFKDLDNM
jgi:hypothetical protein